MHGYPGLTIKRRTEAAENLLQENEPVLLATCTFTNGAYQVVAPGTSTYHRCTAQNTNFSNFAYEVELTIVTGDCEGMLFRASASLWHYYYFRICQDGTYALYLYTHTGAGSVN